MLKNSLIILIITLCSCSHKRESSSQIYYVIQHPKKSTPVFADSLVEPPPLPPPPPLLYYGNLSLILIDTGIYFHNKHRLLDYECGTGIDFTKPPRFFLKPDDWAKVYVNELPAFLSSFNDSLSERKFWISISSPTDTIKSKAFEIIMDFLRSKNFKNYIVRNWTEEEKYSIVAKIKNQNYNPDSINWEVGFDFIEMPSKRYIEEIAKK